MRERLQTPVFSARQRDEAEQVIDVGGPAVGDRDRYLLRDPAAVVAQPRPRRQRIGRVR